LKDAGAKLPATKKAPASPTKATGVRNIPLSCYLSSTIRGNNATVSLMFLSLCVGLTNKKGNKKAGNLYFRKGVLKAPASWSSPHSPCALAGTLDGLMSPSFFASNTSL
jgi:hypothetical protein